MSRRSIVSVMLSLTLASASSGAQPRAPEAVSVDSAGPGNVLSLEMASDGLTELFTGFGERGVSAEAVAETTARARRRLTSPRARSLNGRRRATGATVTTHSPPPAG